MSVLQQPLFAALEFLSVTIAVTVSAAARVRGTTLRGPWMWAILSGSCLTLVELLIHWRHPSETWAATTRYVVATSLFLPMMSLLGAKRPQDRAWHLIVATLWMVLILPAAESYWLRQSGAVQIHDARGWFLWILIGVTWGNYLPTKYRWAVCFFAAAQVALLGSYLPLLKLRGTYESLAAMLLIAAMLGVRFSRREGVSDTQGIWRRFCDTFGFAWGMRVAERVNATGGEAPYQLEWKRMVPAPKTVSDAHGQVVFERTLHAHLSRFVSKDWLSGLGAGGDELEIESSDQATRPDE